MYMYRISLLFSFLTLKRWQILQKATEVCSNMSEGKTCAELKYPSVFVVRPNPYPSSFYKTHAASGTMLHQCICIHFYIFI